MFLYCSSMSNVKRSGELWCGYDGRGSLVSSPKDVYWIATGLGDGISMRFKVRKLESSKHPS
jgi:hypothetical protein